MLVRVVDRKRRRDAAPICPLPAPSAPLQRQSPRAAVRSRDRRWLCPRDDLATLASPRRSCCVDLSAFCLLVWALLGVTQVCAVFDRKGSCLRGHINPNNCVERSETESKHGTHAPLPKDRMRLSWIRPTTKGGLMPATPRAVSKRAPIFRMKRRRGIWINQLPIHLLMEGCCLAFFLVGRTTDRSRRRLAWARTTAQPRPRTLKDRIDLSAVQALGLLGQEIALLVVWGSIKHAARVP